MNKPICLFFSVSIFCSCNFQPEKNTEVEDQATKTELQAVKKIDVHSHYKYDRDYLPDFFKKWNLQGILVDVATEKQNTMVRSWDEYVEIAKSHPDLFWLCSSLIGVDIDKPDFAEQEINRLRQEIKDGAKMVKVWKNFGMVTKDKSGNFIQIDDERLQPIWDFLRDNNIPVIAHIGEPVQAWRPLNDPYNPHYGYYKDHPEYHAYQHTEIPTYETIIAARDRWIANNPALKIVCAHLGSMSHDVSMVAERLDKFQNLYAEPAARFGDLAGQDPEIVKAFFEKYQDRLFFGTDYGTNQRQDSLSELQLQNELTYLDTNYDLLWRYLSSSDSLEIRNQRTKGLALPTNILNKVYYQNVIDLLELN